MQNEHKCDDAPDLVPSQHLVAVRFLEQHARITKLPAGSWRVWLRKAGIRVYGSTREAALAEAAKRVKDRPLKQLLSERANASTSGVCLFNTNPF